jgi:hypothetical protein
VRVTTVHGLTFRGGNSVAFCNNACRNMAGLLTAMLDPSNEDAIYKGGIVRSAAGHGLITDKPRMVTDYGRAWLAHEYRGEVAPLADVLRGVPMPTYSPPARTPKPKRVRKQTPATVTRDLIAAGLILIHPTLIANLGPEETYLWLYCKAHERDRLTVAAVADALHWPVDHTRIRAERCAERGYPLPLVRDGEAA